MSRSSLGDDFYRSLGRVTAESAELDGNLAFLYSALGRRTVRTDQGDTIEAIDVADWLTALKANPIKKVRTRADQLTDNSLRRTVLELCQESQSAMEARDRHVHSLITPTNTQWHPRPGEYGQTYPVPTASELDLLAARLDALNGQAEALWSSIPADSLRTN
jgi:hypothetical protein